MAKHLHHDMDRLHRDILALSSIVEGMIDKATLALLERRQDWAEEVAVEDQTVDDQEVAIEEECLKMLALHQPVASDLRRIATVLKINNDLERIADLAVNIGERAICVSQYREFQIPKRLNRMVELATRMLRMALDAFVNLDHQGARSVLEMDDDVDELNVQIIDELQERMQNDKECVVPSLHCFSASRHIERIADLTTNIAEDVIYLIEGDIVRHHRNPESSVVDPA